MFVSGAPRVALNFAPLGPRATARVIAETSASRLEFTGAAPAGDLMAASFDGPRPDVRVAGGEVTVRYRRQAMSAFTSRRARIALSGTIPWTIELDGGITDLTGTLEAVSLERLDVEGGAEPRPPRPAPAHRDGGGRASAVSSATPGSTGRRASPSPSASTAASPTCASMAGSASRSRA